MEVSNYSLVNIGQQRFWVIRSGKEGTNLPYYRSSNVIGIEHLNDIAFSQESLRSIESKEILLSSYRNHMKKEELSKGTITTNVNQVDTFISRVNIGDIIISLNSNIYIAGIVTSDAYYSNIPLINKDKSHEIKPRLRRKIKWSNPQQKVDVPITVKSSLRSHLTIFSVDEHWRHINHWLSIFFTREDSIYFSTKIKQTDNINNYSHTQFGTLFNYIEAITSCVSKNLDIIDTLDLTKVIEDEFQYLAENDKFNLTTQQVFMSPGDILGEYNIGKNLVQGIIFTIALSACNGIHIDTTEQIKNAKLTSDEIVQIEKVTPMIYKEVEAVKVRLKYEKIKDKLKLKTPQQRVTSEDLTLTLENIASEDHEFPLSEADDFTAI
jgi:hypothetical protein